MRQGRITEAQNKAIVALWPVFGIPPGTRVDSPALFGRKAPLIVEIGFGNGETLALMAKARPDLNFLGIEVHRPGIGHLLLQVQAEDLRNVRVYQGDAVPFLRESIADASLAGMHVYFPDPWPKSRHHKRRLVNAEFLRLVVQKLAPAGLFHAATDWEHYAEQMLEELEACPGLINRAGPRAYSPRPESRPETKFERRGKRLGHAVYDLIFVRA